MFMYINEYRIILSKSICHICFNVFYRHIKVISVYKPKVAVALVPRLVRMTHKQNTNYKADYVYTQFILYTKMVTFISKFILI